MAATLNFSGVFVSFALIEETFSDTSRATLSWGLTGYSITVATLMVPAGWLSDRLGARRLFLAGVSLLGVGTVIVGLAVAPWMFIAGRLVQAVGSGIEIPAGTVLVLAIFPEGRRQTAMGSVSAVGGAAAALGPALGGLLLAVGGWRFTFLAMAPVAFLTVAYGWRRVPDTPQSGEDEPPDVIGALLLMLGVGLLTLAISQGGSWGWSSGATVGCLMGSATAIALLLWRSGRHPAPIVDLSLYRIRDFRLANGMSLLYLGAFAGTYFAMIQFLQNVWDLSPLQAGLLAAVVPIWGGPLSFVAGRRADQIGSRPLIIAGMVFGGIGSLGLAVVLGDERRIGWFIVVTSLYAIGVGLSFAPIAGAAVTRLDAGRFGIGSAVFRITQEIGSAISLAVVVAILATGDGTAAADYTPIFVLAAIICAISLVLATRLSHSRA
ncbi:MAG: MFS transporter [Acidimicrobiia bacterium]|nr:MFS transporter [Acidimicrobiia bacterium]